MYEQNRFILTKVENLHFKIVKGDRTRTIPILHPNNILEETKDKLSLIDQNVWVKTRKIINLYEFPYNPEKLKTKPISRAFFKMLELIKDNQISLKENMLHLAEAPGGFIESILYAKRKSNINGNKHYTFSILGNKKTPIYHKKIVNDEDVFILSDKQNKGDLYNEENIGFLIKELGCKKINLITCDGGFAENNEFSEKEQLHHRLIFNQMVCSLFILNSKGNLVIKIFDIFTELTFDIIYTLSYLFEKIYIHKPLTSRNTNSEKYLYCESFSKNLFDENIQNNLKNLCKSNVENYKSYVDKFKLNEKFLSDIIQINEILSKKQVNSINNILHGTNNNTCLKKQTELWSNTYY